MTSDLEGGPAQRGHEQPVTTASTRHADLALEDHQLVAKHHELDVTVQVSGGSNDQSDKAADHKYANAKCSDGTSRKTEARWYEGPLVEATISGSVLQPDAARSSGGRSPRHVFEAIPPL